MVGNGEPLCLGDGVLAFFNLRVIKLFHLAAIQADQMVVVLSFIEFVHRLVALKVAPDQDPRLLELGENTVNGGQTDIGMTIQKDAVHVFGGHVPVLSALKHFQNFQTGDSGFEAGTFEFVDVGHGVWLRRGPRGPAKVQPLQSPDHIAQPIPMLDSSRLRLTLPLALLLGSLAACSSAPSNKSWMDVVSPYHFDRVQGNVVTREQVNALKEGMPRAVVKDILGTPLLTSVFHADRWDYVFTFRRQGAEPQSRHVAVFFSDDKLARYEADGLPSEAEFVATLQSMPKIEKVPPMEASAESLQKFPPPAAKPAAPAVSKTTTDYPPLEPVSK